MTFSSLTKLAILVVTLGALSACAEVGAYQEPENNGEMLAVVKLDNEDIASSLLGAAIMKPDNMIHFVSIDGKPRSFYSMSMNSMNITPGQHRVKVACAVSNRVFGEKEMTINASPGRVYTIAFPRDLNMHGYTVNLRACDKLIIR